MAVVTDRFVYLHVPKTGGTFFGGMIDSVGQLLGLKYVKITAGHELLPVPRPMIGERSVLYGVRHPAAWLRSIWLHVRRSGGKPDFGQMPYAAQIVEWARRATDIERFFSIVAGQDRVVSAVYSAYAGAYDGMGVELVAIPTEHIVDAFLCWADSWKLLYDVPTENASRITDTICCLNHRTSSAVPRIDWRSCAKLREADPAAFGPFGY